MALSYHASGKKGLVFVGCHAVMLSRVAQYIFYALKLTFEGMWHCHVFGFGHYCCFSTYIFLPSYCLNKLLSSFGPWSWSCKECDTVAFSFLGHKVDLTRNVTLSRFRKWSNGLIYSNRLEKTKIEIRSVAAIVWTGLVLSGRKRASEPVLQKVSSSCRYTLCKRTPAFYGSRGEILGDCFGHFCSSLQLMI